MLIEVHQDGIIGSDVYGSSGLGSNLLEHPFNVTGGPPRHLGSQSWKVSDPGLLEVLLIFGSDILDLLERVGWEGLLLLCVHAGTKAFLEAFVPCPRSGVLH